MRALRRLRPGPDAVELDELPGVRRLVLRPDGLHRLDPLPHHRHPPARVGAVIGHLLPVPPRADAELEPPARQVVNAGDLFRGDDRVALDHQAHAGTDPQPRRRRHRRGHRDEQVERVGVVAGQRPPAGVGCVTGRHVSVLWEEQRLLPPFLGDPGDVARPDRVMGWEDRYAKFHMYHSGARDQPANEGLRPALLTGRADACGVPLGQGPVKALRRLRRARWPPPRSWSRRLAWRGC
jgi:hypothetical protein